MGLEGFREWLVARNGAPELRWTDHIRSLAPNDADDLQLRNTIFDTLQTFWSDRESRGLQAIIDDFRARVES